MKKNIFNGLHMLVMVAVTAAVTAALMAGHRPIEQTGKYAILDKETAVASVVFGKSEFNEDDRRKIVAAITAIQQRYTDQGYAVLTKEGCKADAGAIVLAAVPNTPLDITQELIDAIHQALGEKR